MTTRQSREDRPGAAADAGMPLELNPARIRRRLLQFAVVVAAVVLFIVLGPNLSGLRKEFAHASPEWVAVAVGFELLSALAYVITFRAVFCPEMSWRLSYDIGMSEQAANSVLSVSGAGGLALGAWALRRGGMRTEFIGRRTVAFFFLTSLTNVGGVILFAVLYAVGLLTHVHNAALTYVFGGLAAASVLVVLALPRLLMRHPPAPPTQPRSGKLPAALHFIRYSLGQGIQDAITLLRARPVPVLGGSLAITAFDLATLAAAFKAVGYSPPVGVLVLGYLIGLMGGSIPIPGGVGGLDGGLIGAFALYHQPLAAVAGGVIIYHAISLWLPALLGSVAFVQLRRKLQGHSTPAAICAPLADPITAEELDGYSPPERLT